MTNLPRRTTTTLATLSVAGLLLAGCGGSNGDTDSDQSQEAQETPGTAQSQEGKAASGDMPTSGATGTNTAEVAKTAIDTAEAEGGIAFAVDYSQNQDAWEVEVIDGDTKIEHTLVSDGTSITGNNEEQADEDDKSALQTVGISIQQAIDTASSEHPGLIDEVELDEKNGTLIYEFDIYPDDGSKVELSVDAKSGDIVK